MELKFEQEQHVRKFLYKSLLNSVDLWSRAQLTIKKQRKQKYFTLPIPNLLKIRFLLLVSTKGKNGDKIKFVTEFVGIIVTIIFT